MSTKRTFVSEQKDARDRKRLRNGFGECMRNLEGQHDQAQAPECILLKGCRM